MTAHTIHITGINTNTGKLILSGPNNTIYPGDTVTWEIDSGSGVQSISAITNNHTNHPNEEDVFSVEPTVANNWQGTINPNITSNEHEYYTITWTDTNSISHTYDPQIQVSPKPGED